MPVPRASELTWLCGSCCQPVSDWDGYVYVSVHAAQRRLESQREWRQRHSAALAVSAATLTELREMPGEAHWRVTHNRCGGDASPFDAYCLDPGGVATWRDLAKWTAHLMAKNWLPGTDWDEVLREASGEVPSSRVRIRQGVAA